MYSYKYTNRRSITLFIKCTGIRVWGETVIYVKHVYKCLERLLFIFNVKCIRGENNTMYLCFTWMEFII